MRIRRISVFGVTLPLRDGPYRWARGHAVEAFDATVVRVDTDGGVSGYGESCPLGPAYLPAHAEGVRAAIGRLGPELVGADPLQPLVLNRLMDAGLRGHAAAKAALDVACWDVLGQVSGLPVATLLGGRFGPDVGLYRAISQGTPAAMAAAVAGYRAEGYRKFQLKVGGGVLDDIARIREVAAVLEPGDTLVADANGGWLLHEAVRVVAAVRDLPVYIEQPCRTYDECRSVRARTALPMILDEVIDDAATLVRAVADGALDAVNIKIGKVGGLTRARQMRDLAASLGVAATIEDTWGSDIATAAIAHLAQSTPPEALLSTTDFNSYVTARTADGGPLRRAGRMAASAEPGLGVRPREEALGLPLLVIGA